MATLEQQHRVRGGQPEVLEVDRVHVHKAYGATVALDGVDLVVPAGTILGLLGPNGAGKTTLVSIVAGLRRADAGTVRVCGIDMARKPQQARHLVGLAPQDTGVYPPLTVRDNLRVFAGLAGLRGRDLRERIDAVASALGLYDLLDRRGSDLSGGERRRLHTAMALVHRPKLVLLDEPTTGADVRTRSEILGLVRSLADDGSAVVYSTHYLHEIEELQASVAFIDGGRIVARGELRDLVQQFGSSALELTFEGDIPPAVRVDGAIVDGASVRIPTSDPASTAAELLPRLGVETAGLRAIEVVRPSLESVFLSVTGRRYEQRVDEPAGVISFRRLGVILAHELRVVRRDPLPLMVLVVFPIITMAFLKPAFQPALAQGGHPEANGAEHVVPGQAAMSAFFLVSLMSFAFFAEHGWATWDRLRASPASSFEIIMGKALPRIVIGVAQFVVILVAGVVLFDLHVQGDVLALTPLIVAFSLCLVLLGVAATALAHTAQQANTFAYLGMVLFGAIGGALVPYNVLPDWARAIAPVTPTYWAMRGLRSVILDGEGVAAVALPTLVLVAMGLLFATVAVRRFRFDETKVGWA